MRTTRAPGGSCPAGREWKPTGLPRLLISPSKMWVRLTGGDVRLHSSAGRWGEREAASPWKPRRSPRIRTGIERSGRIFFIQGVTISERWEPSPLPPRPSPLPLSRPLPLPPHRERGKEREEKAHKPFLLFSLLSL